MAQLDSYGEVETQQAPAIVVTDDTRAEAMMALAECLISPAKIAEFLESVEFYNPVDPSQIADHFNKGTQGDTDHSCGLRPIAIGMQDQMEVITNPALKDLKLKVLAVSMGGTNIKAGWGSASLKDGIQLDGFATKSLKDNSETALEYSDTNALWAGIIPAEMVEQLKTYTEDNLPQISFVPGFPVEILPNGDGRVVHFSQKLRCNAMGPFNAEGIDGYDREGQPTIQETLAYYLQSQGIDITTDQISLVPNDTFATGLAHAGEFEPNKNYGAIIDGTGFNIGTLNHSEPSCNTESGHYAGLQPSTLDKEVCVAKKFTPDFETLVSGKIMGDVFKLALKKLSDQNDRLNDLYTKIANRSNDDLTQLIFALSYDSEMPAGIKLSDLERNTLGYLADNFTCRAADYIATMIVGLGIEASLLAEGSLLTKNQGFIGS